LIPGRVAGVFTQALSTGWSAFQMARSSSFKAQYEATIVHGACSGVDVLPDYFSHRTQDEASSFLSHFEANTYFHVDSYRRFERGIPGDDARIVVEDVPGQFIRFRYFSPRLLNDF
jgi:hypothetical protein